MSFDYKGVDQTFIAGADLSGYQFRAVKVTGVDANTGYALIGLAGAGEFAIGVLQDKPVAGHSCRVRTGGVSKMVASGAIAVPALVASDATGKAKAAVTGSTNTADAGGATDALVGSFVLGSILSPASAAGDIVPVLVHPMGAVPATAA